METLASRLLAEIETIPIIDAHTHIDPRRPTAADLDDLLGYHYYTELAHSAGMGREALRSEVPAEERAREIARFLPQLENTIQYSWLLDIARELFGFEGERLDESCVDELWRAADRTLTQGDWEQNLLHRYKIEKLFLTNDFDDPLEGFDTTRYVPCLRVDDLIFRLSDASIVERVRQTSRTDIGNAASLRDALSAILQRFAGQGARACAVSLPHDFSPTALDTSGVDPLLRRLLAGESLSDTERRTVAHFVFWMVTELCGEHGLAFDLMIGVNRGVYTDGVHQGRDLFNRLSSLHQFQELFNAFPNVKFPVSVLASEGNQELVAYSWIFPNVVAAGHWWYSNVPALIEQDARARLQAVPRTKQLGYYSDAYKLEFVQPKFSMYRRILSKILARDFVEERGWSEEKAVGLARDLLHDNVERIFLTETVKETQP